MSETAHNSSAGLTVIDINKQDHLTSKGVMDLPLTKAGNVQTECEAISMSTPPSILLKSASTKTAKSPRRLLLTKRVLHEANRQQNKPKVMAPPNISKKQPVVMLEHGGRSMYTSLNISSCACYGKPIICSICMTRLVFLL